MFSWRIVPSYDQWFAIICPRDSVGQKTRFAEGPQAVMECSGRSLIFDLNKNLVAAAQRFSAIRPPLHERSGCHSLAERRNRLVSQDAGTLTQIVNQHGYGSTRRALGRTSECVPAMSRCAHL